MWQEIKADFKKDMKRRAEFTWYVMTSRFYWWYIMPVIIVLGWFKAK